MPKQICLRNSQCPGDLLVMTAAIQSLHDLYKGEYLTTVQTPHDDIFWHNPLVVPYDASYQRLEMNQRLIHESNQRPVHFMEAYTELLQEYLKVPIHLTVTHPIIHLTDEEKVPMYNGSYALICEGTKGDYTTKHWGTENYQGIVDALKDKITFIQVGNGEGTHRLLDGVLDLRNRTSIRDLFRLAYGAVFGIGPVTFLHHIFAAFEKPYFCLARAAEPKRWEDYETARTYHMGYMLECAGCWKNKISKDPHQFPVDNDPSVCLYPEVLVPEILELPLKS